MRQVTGFSFAFGEKPKKLVLKLDSWEKSTGRGDKSRMTVELKPGESQESLLKRFRKQVTESGILSTVRKRRWYVSKSEERRRAKAKAIRRARRRERQKRQRQ